MRTSFVWRIRIIFVLLLIGASFLSLRLYFLQVVKADEYREAATNQYVATDTTQADRGEILFSPRDSVPVAAARMVLGYRVAIQPDDIVDPEAVYAALTNVVAIERERFFRSASKTDDPYEEVAFRITEEQATGIRDLGLDGVVIVPEKWRFYPADERAAHVLGYVGYKGDERVGQYGLEQYWENTLARNSGGLYVNFFAEIFSNIRALAAQESDSHEGDLITSIEPVVQQKLEDILVDIENEYNPKEMGGIVMDPNTGAILAMAARPTFNPNAYGDVPDIAVFSNPLVENVYEMGSIVKPLTMAAGIDAGAVTARTTYDDKGFIIKSGARISNYDGVGRGVVSMQEVLNQSLNTGVAFVVDQMGEKVFADYMYKYGLAETTGIDLPNEARGIMGALESGADVDYASASFGQGFAVSPITMTRALAVLANGGELVRPHVVSEVRLSSGITKHVWEGAETRVIKPETAEEITRMLVTVFDDALLGGDLKEDRYSIAAKTGTAQIAIPGGGGYYADRFLHSFFGYFPAHDAQFIVFLFANEPQGVQYASQTLSRPFMKLARSLINYYDIPPDR